MVYFFKLYSYLKSYFLDALRYVRELLNSLVCAQIVDIECHGNKHYYNIDTDQGSVLLDHGRPNVLGVSSVSVRFEPVMKCIRKDGPYGMWLLSCKKFL
jgi:hypothetical protein